MDMAVNNGSQPTFHSFLKEMDGLDIEKENADTDSISEIAHGYLDNRGSLLSLLNLKTSPWLAL